MSPKGKKARAPEVQHLNDAQFSELAVVAWEFLELQAGSREAALRLKPKKIKEYAGHFLYESDPVYWPLSDMNQWQYDCTEDEVKVWIANLMTRERSQQEMMDSTIVGDDPMEGPSSGKKPQTLRQLQGQTAKKIPPLKSPAKLDQGSQRLVETEGPKRDGGNITTRLTKSPTIVPDIPYADSPETTQPSPRKSIRPTPESIKIANEKFDKPDGDRALSGGRADRSNTLGLGLTASPKTPRKRPMEETKDGLDISTPTPAERENKRQALGVATSYTGGALPGSSLFPRDESSVPQTTDSSLLIQVRRQNGQDYTVPSGDHEREIPNFIVASGLTFTPDNLSKVPVRVLGYLTECIHHQIRQANETSDISLQREYRARSTLFQNLHADLESRIKCLAQDAAAEGRVESSHCLWN